ncbi:MAG: UDP-N-acetylmuramoyl-tripeptide--D-alanyl-D-alanine ligase, partial [Synergistetes bacterium]|nr:UDP-N-acetylmuramoyl-tripeptide--D-alanyl-D-alanine ligase [Synergistota bacterium]
MYPMRLGEILDIMGGIPRNIDETELVVGISTDSREIGEGELFFAIRGDRFDGHDFVKDAVNSGAVAVVVDRPVDDSLPYILVEDTSSAMLLLACRYVSRFDATIVAVTGSFGKTTTKELISAALSEAFRVVKAPKSFNNMVGLSKTLFAVEGDTDYVVVELGTNHPGEIAKLTEHLWIDDLILTAIGKTHVGYFGSVSAILEEKLSSLRRLKPDGRLFVNVDNPHLRAFEYER